jgi:hypothetical protein
VCHFITAVLPEDARIDALDPIARKYGRRFQPQGNPSIEAQLRPGERYFVTTVGHCDCGTPLGALVPRPGSRKPLDHEIALKQLRAKGWSETKISRWLAQKRGAEARVQRTRSDDDTPAIDAWVAFLTEVLESKATSYMAVLVHRYGGPLSERIPLAGREVVRFDDSAAAMLSYLKEDVLYEFRRA